MFKLIRLSIDALAYVLNKMKPAQLVRLMQTCHFGEAIADKALKGCFCPVNKVILQLGYGLTITRDEEEVPVETVLQSHFRLYIYLFDASVIPNVDSLAIEFILNTFQGRVVQIEILRLQRTDISVDSLRTLLITFRVACIETDDPLFLDQLAQMAHKHNYENDGAIFYLLHEFHYVDVILSCSLKPDTLQRVIEHILRGDVYPLGWLIKMALDKAEKFEAIVSLAANSPTSDDISYIERISKVELLAVGPCGSFSIKNINCDLVVLSGAAHRIDEDICEELVRGDRFVDGYFHCSETAPLSIVKKITKNWEEGAEEDEAIELNSSEILYGREKFYKWEVWMGKVAGGDAKWQIISMRRPADSIITYCTIETAMSRADFHLKLVDLLGNIYCRSAFDFSEFHGALEQMDSLEGIKDVFYEMGNFIGTFLA